MKQGRSSRMVGVILRSPLTYADIYAFVMSAECDRRATLCLTGDNAGIYSHYGDDTSLYMQKCPPCGANSHRIVPSVARAERAEDHPNILLRAILSGEAAKSITALAEEVGIDRTTTGKKMRLLERDEFGLTGRGE